MEGSEKVSIHSLPADFPRGTSAALFFFRFSFHLSIYLFIYLLCFSGGQRGVRGEREACQTRGGGEGGAQKKCTASADFWLRTEAA